ncbi:MAG: hypothetical protein A2073_01920 [Deltaproteobacteria bacterium GWC2_42_11]|nr:MAG: hypothetical protein A2073_01920 [Deltaproteobacteria bacterium GWC2_42_11]HBO84888.1 hypothetical protein [Deltaproteobacteria bacterium]
MNLKHHKTLTKEKWLTFPFYKQVIMIANEMNRAGKWIEKNDFLEVRYCYERAFELLYLTISTLNDKKKLRELLRFKEMLAVFYASKLPAPKDNLNLLKVLIAMDKDSFSLLKI